MNTCTRAQITTHEELITIVTRFDSLSGLFWCLFACLTEAKRKLKHRRRKSQLYGIQFLKIRCNGLCSRRGNAESLTIGNSSIRLNQEKLLCTSVTLLYTSQWSSVWDSSWDLWFWLEIFTSAWRSGVCLPDFTNKRQTNNSFRTKF